MKELFLTNILPMKLKTISKPFDDENYIFELKLDGIRCIMFCDEKKTVLQNRNLKIINDTYPELLALHRQCKNKCILDGEIVYANEQGFPDFQALQKRNMASKKTQAEMWAKRYPVSFVAFDILSLGDKNLVAMPLIERKKFLKKNISENEFISVARYIEKSGVEFFGQIQKLSLEGIIAKKKNSPYLIGVRSDNWLKIKNLIYEDYTVCGYVPDESGNVKNLILAKKHGKNLIFDGEIYVPAQADKNFVLNFAKNNPGKELFKNLKKNVVWILPKLVCTVEFVQKTKTGERRQPIFAGFRTD